MGLDKSASNGLSTEKLEKPRNDYKWKIVWENLLSFIYIHLAGLYGMYLMLFLHVKYLTILWYAVCTLFIMIGITAGAHRLWSHRSYKAKWPMRLILMLLQSAAYQNTIYRWARDHRVHHKYTDTDADPHNANRGLFFSHIGWLLIRKHPEVKAKGEMIDCTDLAQDPFVAFQRKWYKWLMPTFGFILPTLIPYWFWNETLSCAWHISFARYCTNLNSTWMVNSFAHSYVWGTRPYDKSMRPADNFSLAMLTFGEGWHNYHHVFPWDYRSGGLGKGINITSMFIHFFAFFGLAYDMKITSPEVIKQRAVRCGDGSF
ncbi:acyl-CoA Delta(11) desaturase [Harpegnathos saltator]|uniref:Acyl-CoA Delta(11) desaturase n=1 Tax=Harpegnathos saltator TaxID=610380 RepID=E2B6S4_HARSA|nr:acyl-CoA Delta(11) desaturase [Harpegnathos saltator]EFN88658.1 Acyl-CoA Delta(11) desaturase [Harpegnathos saltator]